MSIPFDDVNMATQSDWYREMADMGYTDLWSAEAGGADGFVPLAIAAERAPRLNLGTAVVPVFTRGPALMAMSAATMAEVAPGRFSLGIGTSSDVIVENWNDIAFDEPCRKMRDMIRFLKMAFTGDKIDTAFDTFTIRGFRLGRPVEIPPPILIGALRPGMLHLAQREADGAIINWLGASDVPKVVAELGPGKQVVARIFVCPSTDTDSVRRFGRLAINAYLNVAVYAAFHEWLGRGPLLEPMWEAWRAGDRKHAAELIPDEVVDSLIVHGSPDECKAHIQRYVDNGVTVPVIGLLPVGIDSFSAIRDLAP